MADLGLLVPITGSARTSSARRWILIGGLLLLGGLLGVGLGMTWNGGLLLAGASAAVGLQALGLRRLVALLVGATFVTLFRIDVAGLSFRPEHFALVPCLAAVVLAGRSRALVDAALDRTVLLLGSFVAWNAIVSIFQAPDPGASLRIVGWLLIDWLILVTLVAVIDDPEDLARQGALWAGLASCVALALWAGAGVVGLPFGVANDPFFGARAATGLSFEANLLASTLAVWAFVTISAVKSLGWPARYAIVALAVTALGLSLTRAAVIGLGTGLMVWAALSGRLARHRTLRLIGLAVVAASLLYLLAPSVVEPIAGKGRQLFDLSAGTGRQRVETVRTAAADLHGLDWVVGLGTNSFGQRHLEPTLPDTPTPAYLGNLPVQLVYDSGLVGGVLLLATLVSVLPRDRRRGARALALVVVYVACAAATSPLWFGTTWVLAAMALVDRRRHELREGEPMRPSTVQTLNTLNPGSRPLGDSHRRLSRARHELVELRRQLDEAVERARVADSEAQGQVMAAEERARQAEERTRQAEERAAQAEERTRQAEERTRQAEERAERQATRASQALAEGRHQAAEAVAQTARAVAQAAEAVEHASQAEARARASAARERLVRLEAAVLRSQRGALARPGSSRRRSWWERRREP